MYTTVTLNRTAPLTQPAPNFRLADHTSTIRTLDTVTGASGALLAFVGDIWLAVTVQRILGLQRLASKTAALGCPAAGVITSSVATLSTFLFSSPLPVPYPLLADPDGSAHRAYRAASAPVLILLDRDHMPRHRWNLTLTHLLPPAEEVMAAVEKLAEQPRTLNS